MLADIACGSGGIFVQSGDFVNSKIFDGEGELIDRFQKGLDHGFSFYEKDITNLTQLAHYGRLRDLRAFAGNPESGIRSTGFRIPWKQRYGR